MLLRVMSHELRTPVGVMQGCLRMLAEGPPDDALRDRLFGQLQRATTRIAAIGRQTSDLSQWLGPRGDARPMAISAQTLLLDVVRLATDNGLSVTPIEEPPGTASIPSVDPAALAHAGLALVEAASRRSGAAILTGVRPADEGIDLWAGPTADALDGPENSRLAIDFEEGGLGLALFVGAAVVAAHHGSLWRSEDGSILGMRLPGAATS